jgi:pimeloyl-ACP methyl ester carboxylesterase
VLARRKRRVRHPLGRRGVEDDSHILEVPGGSHLTLISHPAAVTNQILAAARSVH